MPDNSLESIQKELITIDKQTIIEELKKRLQSEYGNKRYTFFCCYDNEKRLINSKRNDELTQLGQQYALSKKKLNNDFEDEMAGLDAALAQKNKPIEEIDKITRQRAALQQGNEQSLRNLDVSYAEKTQEQEQIATERLNKLEILKTQITNKLSDDLRYIETIILSDDFFNQFLMPGISKLADAIQCFFKHHSWAKDQKNMVLQCFAYSHMDKQKNAPWQIFGQNLKQTIGKVDTTLFASSFQFNSLKDYEAWTKQSVATTNIEQYKNICRKIEVLNLTEEQVAPYMREFLYTPQNASDFYFQHRRAGIKSFSYGRFDSPAEVDLTIRRMDWLRSLELISSWHNINLDGKRIYPVLPLSIDEIERFSLEQNLTKIILNVADEDNPLWILVEKNAGKWNVYIPEGEFYKELVAKITQALNTKLSPSTHTKINFTPISLSGHYIEKEDAANLPPEIIWHAVLGSRVLPFSIDKQKHTDTPIENYRQNVPISLLLPSTLSLVAQSNPPKGYFSRTDMNANYTKRSFCARPTPLHQTWRRTFTPKQCLPVDQNWFLYRNPHQFLLSIDKKAVVIENIVGNPPIIHLEPSNQIPTLHSVERSLDRNDFFYIMVLVYHHNINTINLGNHKWLLQWRDCNDDFRLYNNLWPELPRYPTTRHLLDSNCSLTQVTPLTQNLPPLMRHAAACAARNRLMLPYFSDENKTHDNSAVVLWQATGNKVLELLQLIDNKTEEERESFFKALANSRSTLGPTRQTCVDNQLWEIAQIAQMDLPGIDLIFKHREKSAKPSKSLTFDLNCKTLSAAEYLGHINNYMKAYKKPPLERVNFCMPPVLDTNGDELYKIFGEFLSLTGENGEVYLYNMQTQNQRDRLDFLQNLCSHIEKSNVTTLIKIPEYDLSTNLTQQPDSQAHDIYRKIQNCILNNRRKKNAKDIPENTNMLQKYAIGELLPAVTTLRLLEEDYVMPPSEEEATYVVGSTSNGIQQQLQQAQAQQKQVTQQKQHAVAVQMQVEVEAEVQIQQYRNTQKKLITRENIDIECKEFWQHLPEKVNACSGYNEKSTAPLHDLFNLWVGNESPYATHVIQYIDQPAAEKIMQHASKFRFGMFYDNLPPGFYLENKDGKLVLCFDNIAEKNELEQLNLARKNGKMKKRHITKMVLHDPMQAKNMPGGDDRQFVALQPSAQQKEQAEIRATYWKHLVTEEKPRQAFEEAARKALSDESSSQKTIIARIQSALQCTAIQTLHKPNANEQDAAAKSLEKWFSTYVKDAKFVSLLFLQNAEGKPLDKTKSSELLAAFGQIVSTFDTLPFDPKNSGSFQFMQLAYQIYSQFKDNPQYFCIWRDRLLQPSAHFGECLQKNEVNAVVESLRVLKDRPIHSDFWWSLVDAHGQSVGHMQYMELWSTCCDLFHTIDLQRLQLTPHVLNEWKKTLQTTNPINGQVLIERLQSIIKRAALSTENKYTSQEYQQEILNNLSAIDWHHDGHFYAVLYECFPGFWDRDFFTSKFDKASDLHKSSYIPSLDNFQQQADHELISAIRYIGRYYAHDKLKYKDLKNLLQNFWGQAQRFIRKTSSEETDLTAELDDPFLLQKMAEGAHIGQNEHLTQTLNSLPTQVRVSILRLILMSFVFGQDNADKSPNSSMQELLKLCENKSCVDILLKLSQAKNLDDVKQREVFWTLRFEHLPSLINTLSKPECRSIADSLQNGSIIEFAKQAEFAMSCFESPAFANFLETLHIAHQNKAELFTKWVKLQEEKPYLKAFPWLILNADNLSERLEKTLINLATQGGDQYQILLQQIFSIDFNLSRYLPYIDNITEHLSKQPLTAKQRKDFIAYASKNGAHIIYQEAQFRILTDAEKTSFKEAFKRRMEDTAYFSINNALFQNFIDKVAVPQKTQAENEKSLDSFIQTLSLVHNKVYYNELGQLLGLIVETASVDGPHPHEYYSLPQLEEWIKILIPRREEKEKHYPVHLLKEALHEPCPQQMTKGLIKPIDKLHECELAPPPKPYFSYITTTLKDRWLTLASSKLPNQYAALIVRLMLRSADFYKLSEKLNMVFQEKKFARNVIEAFYQFLQNPKLLENFTIGNTTKWFDYISADIEKNVDSEMHQEAILQLTEYLKTQITPKCDAAGKANPDWQIPRDKIDALWDLIGFKASGWLSLSAANKYLSQKKLIILAYATQGSFETTQETATLLGKLTESAMDSLIAYYKSGATLPITDLIKLLAHIEAPAKNHIDTSIQHFETVVQGLKKDGSPKRVYSAAPIADLLRVISGFEKKGIARSPDKEQRLLANLLYYMNEYSQIRTLDKLPIAALQTELHAARKDLSKFTDKTSQEAQLASCRLLACMREILLRRTGKWANHTQMLALIYAACHNDESMIYQLRTGQGKSIISLMRASYLALTGDVVDVFSAKESLSFRDYNEAKPIMMAMGVPCNYISADAIHNTYKQRSGNPPIGAVHFATPGNFSLFLSNHAWALNKITLDPQHRVAFADETDHIILDDHTLFNFPEPVLQKDAYNFDEWVYREVFHFYQEVICKNKEFIKTRVISRQTHLDDLAQRLVRLARNAPEDSSFFSKYLLPAMTAKRANRKEAILKRDEALVYLIKAAHAANELKEGVDFCISQDRRTLLDQTVPVHILQVMIGNQVQLGATYSEAVQQFACVRKNEESAAQGKTPDHFVDPESKIILSKNCESLFSTHYRKIEGCTGTTGNTQELVEYAKKFNITHVLKLPTHEEVRTEFKPTVYASSFEEQIRTIVKRIEYYSYKQPILITCKDDIEVKRLHAAISKQITEKQLNVNLIRDTNDSGKLEADIVPLAGALHSVTISSRMGRGTDIKPQSADGLYVVRTSPASARVTKQEMGRQGRNGANGVCETILDAAALAHEYDTYQLIESRSQQLARIFKHENNHLDAKMQKHQKIGSKKFDWLKNEEKRTNYLKARTCIQFRNQLHEEQQVKLRRQEALITWMSTAVEAFLQIAESQSASTNELKKEWKICRDTIEKAWNNFLADQKANQLTHQKNPKPWSDFIEKCTDAWLKVVNIAEKNKTQRASWLAKFSQQKLLELHGQPMAHPEEKELHERPPKQLYTAPQLDKLINLHQKWMEKAIECRQNCLAHAEECNHTTLNKELDGAALTGFNALFLQLRNLHPNFISSFEYFYNALYQAFDNKLLLMMPSSEASFWIDKWTMALQSTEEEINHKKIDVLDIIKKVLDTINEKLPNELKAQFAPLHPTRYAYVVHLITDLALSVDLKAWKTATPQIMTFLENIGQVLTHSKWQEIQKENTRKLLRDFLILPQIASNKEHVVESLARGFPTTESVKTLITMLIKTDESSLDSETFRTYLSHNAALLRDERYASLLPIITDLTVGKESVQQQVNQLPNIDYFMHPASCEPQTTFSREFLASSPATQLEYNKKFWMFLSQRQPLENSKIQNFYALVQKHCTLAEALQITELPPYITLATIEETLLIPTVSKSLDSLFHAATTLNSWLAAQNYVATAKTYTAPSKEQLDSAYPWIKIFELLPHEKSEVLFKAMRQSQIPGHLPEALREQLVSVIKNAPCPLDLNTVVLYCESMLMISNLHKSWCQALTPCLQQLDLKDKNQGRLQFLTTLTQQIGNDHEITANIKTFPMQCYEAWLNGRFDEAWQPLQQLMTLYKFAATSPANQVLLKALPHCMQINKNKAGWSAAIDDITNYLHVFCQLPQEWQQNFADSIFKETQEDIAQQWHSLFIALMSLPETQSEKKAAELGLAIAAHWISHPISMQTAKIRGLQCVLQLYSQKQKNRLLSKFAEKSEVRRENVFPELSQWIIEAYLNSKDKNFEHDVELIKLRKEILLALDALPSDWQSVFLEKTGEIIKQDSITTLKRWQICLNLLKTTLPNKPFLDKSTVQLPFNNIWKNYENAPLESFEKNFSRDICNSMLMTSPVRESTSKEKRDFIVAEHKALLTNKTPEILTDFRQFITESPDDWPKESYEAVWNGIKAKQLSIQYNNDPKYNTYCNAMEMTQEALTAKTQKKLDSWFTQDATKREKRIALLQGIHNGYISLDKKTDESCWQNFAKMISGYLPKKFGTDYHLCVTKSLASLKQALGEIEIISKPLVGSVNNSRLGLGPTTETVAQLAQRQNTDFDALQKEYDNAWWKNIDRKRQSNKLFKDIKTIDLKNKSREDYYFALLGKIKETLNEIIKSDKDAIKLRNKKGYSRLHDICIKMLVDVARDYLLDNHNSLATKDVRANKIKDLLSNICKTHQDTHNERGLFNQPTNALDYLNDVIEKLAETQGGHYANKKY